MELAKLPYWLRLSIAAVGYALAAALDAVVVHGALPAPAWLPAGMGLAAIILLGYDVWPSVLVVGTFIAIITGYPPAVVAALAVSYAATPLLGAWLVNRAGAHPALGHVRDTWLFVFWGAIVGTLPALLPGLAAVATGFRPVAAVAGATDLSLLFEWWLSAATGVLIVAPALLTTVATPQVFGERNVGVIAEMTAITAATVASSAIAFGPPGSHAPWAYPFIVLPAMVWATVRYEQVGAAVASFVVGLIAIAGTVAGYGQFATNAGGFGYASLQVYLLSTIATLLVAAAYVNERHILQERYRHLVERLPAVTYEASLDPEHPWEFVSPQIETTLGYDRDTWQAMEPGRLELIHPEDRESVASAFAGLSPGCGVDVEYRIRGADGDYHWVYDRATSVTDAHGRPLIAGTFVDVTGTRRAQEELVRSRAFYKAIFDAAAVGIGTVASDGHWRLANAELQRFLGYSEAELRKLTSLDVTHPDDLEVGRAALDDLRSGARDTAHLVKRYITKGGETVWADLSLTAVRDIDGEFDHFLGAIVDITESKRAQAALTEAEARYRAIIENTSDVIARVGPDGVFTYVNPSGAALLGMRAQDVEGLTLARAGFPDAEEAWAREFAQVRETGVAREREVSVVLPDGPRFFSTLMIRDTADAGSVIIMARDLTKRRATELAAAEQRQALEEVVARRTRELSEANERLMELDRLKSMFIASMSHELRTPLNSVIGFSGVLLSGVPGKLSAEQRAQLEMVNAAGNHLLELIGDILDVSQVEAGTIKAKCEEFDLGELEREAVDLLRPQADSAHLSLEADEPHVIMRGDRRRVLQCVVNLMSNAVKYTERGSVRVATEARDGEVTISVADTGIGIAPSDENRIFEPFTRLESPLRAKTPGTGLGLYLTQKVAEEILDGGISFTSKPGKGSTFELTLPVEAAGCAQAGAAPSAGLSR